MSGQRTTTSTVGCLGGGLDAVLTTTAAVTAEQRLERYRAALAAYPDRFHALRVQFGQMHQRAIKTGVRIGYAAWQKRMPALWPPECSSADQAGTPMEHRNQLDIFDHDPARLAQANRVAAEHALSDPFFSAKVRQDRHDYYLAEAERLEGLAAKCKAPTTTTA